MSGENEDVKAYEVSSIAEKQSKILYSREFLLSFSELDSCKKLPSGFDPSILSEFEDAFHKEQERQRAPVGSQWQGYKRSEYSSSPPTQGDSGTYSRSNYGRWDTRSYGRSERDSDSQSDKDSDPGRHHVNPSRRPWQSSDHDGVLGSGSFPRPGSGSGNSLLKGRPTDDYQLNRSNGSYAPPRPYKAAPLFVRETKDSFNDETFGSSEGASEDKVEEERQRRASFELMRKQQHEVLQGKQKVKAGAGISEFLENMKEEKSDLGGSDVLHESATAAFPVHDFVKSSIPSQTTTSRPLVPPGFANAIGEKNSIMKPSVHTHKVEIAKSKPKELPSTYGPLESLERQSSQDHNDHRLEDRSTHTILLDNETKMDLPYSFEVSELKPHMGDGMFRTSSLSETHDSFDNHEVIPKVSGSKAQGDSYKSQTNIVLDNIFGSTLPIDSTSSTSPAKQPDGKPDKTWTPSSVQSSKFAHWFLEEERKPAEDLTYGRPNDLLSLIAGGDKGINHPSDEKFTGHLPSENSRDSSVFASEIMSGLSFKSNDISNHQSGSSKTNAIPSVLTCEDLEQTILSECTSQNLPPTEQSIQCSSVSDAKSEQVRPVDNHASQHLLSLLHKDTGLNKMQLRTDMEIRLNDVLPSDEWDMQAALGETSGEGLKGDPGSSTPTLEALFGSAFMRELQSADAPVSVQRGSVESTQTDISDNLGLPFSSMNGGSTNIATNEVGQKSTSQRGNNLPLNHRQKSRSESWLEISNSHDEPDSLKNLIGLNSRHSGILEVDRYQLPKEERLITDHPNLMVRPAAPSLQGQLSSNAPINRIGPEIPHHNLYARPPSLQFQNPMMSQERPLPFPLDSHPAHMNPHMKFLGPESMIHRDPLANHQLPENMARPPFPHPSAGVTGVNITSHNPILQQMQTSGNHPQQLSHRFQSTAFPHPGNQANTLIPELNPMREFPFSPHHPHNMSISGPRIPAPNINNGRNHPEAFQMLLEMERRAKSKQIHPPPSHSQTMYNNELNRGFRYE